MKLKHYQEKVLKELTEYLRSLSEFQGKYKKYLGIDPDMAKDYNFPKRAWENSTGRTIYYSKTNGLDEPLPDIYLKVPTGGGKTLLACHSIDLIQKTYLESQTGLILWIVPSTQIYRQTISALKSREHPYRQILDISSGGRTLIKEKTELFNRLDVEENLVVLMLMLPSANRLNKQLVQADNSPIQRSLFEQSFEEEFNETEKKVAIYLDEQGKLLWWYRNISRLDYHIQGWRKNKIYPDFIAAKAGREDKTDYSTVYVLETKGVQLKANDDTRYKENVFALCNDLGAKKPWKELFDDFPDHNFEFQVVFEDEWQNRINLLLERGVPRDFSL